MQNLSSKTLAVFHSYKMSFAEWQTAGILERELVLYRALKPYFKKIMFVSYSDDISAEFSLAKGDFEVVSYKNLDALKDSDIFRINQMSGFMSARKAKKMFPDKKLVVRCGFMWSQFQKHNNIFKKWFVSRMEQKAFNVADAIITTSGADSRYIQERYDVQGERVTIIRNLIDTELFRPNESSENSKKICAVGRLEHQKNYHSLILALKGSDYELDIFGQGQLRDELEALALENGVSAHFRGVVSNTELAQLVSQYACFVIASHYEGNPKSLLEAMSAGLPVIASDIDAHRDIITDGDNGLLVTDFRVAIDKVIGDNALAQKLGNNAREWIMKNCSLPVILKQELDLYGKL